MATYRQRQRTVTKVIDNGLGVYPSSRVGTLGNDLVPDKVSGGFVTFEDGSKFRLPTSYSRRSVWIEPGGSQNTYGRFGPYTQHATTGPGGYDSDSLLTQNCPSTPGPSGALSKFSQDAAFPQGMKNEARTKALLRLADAKAGIGEDLATFRQTLGMIHSPASALAGSLRAAHADKSLRPLLTRTLRDIRREGPLKTAARKYLEYVYGWKPLVEDIHGIMTLMKAQGQRPLLLHGSGSSKVRGPTKVGTFNDVSNKCINTVGPCVEDVRARCEIWGRIDPNHAGLRALNQLGLLNPLSLSWELVPWSFVIDWFCPIGPVLQALTAPAGLSFVAGSDSLRASLTGPYESHQTDFDPWMVSSVFANGTVRHESYQRTTLGSFPLPGVWFSSDPFKKDRPWKALALTISNLRGLRI